MSALRPDEAALRDAAIAAYDRVLADEPTLSHQALAEATQAVVRLRDALIARGRATGDVPDALAAVNAIVSLAWAAQMPVAGVRRDRMEQTREALRDLS